MLLGDLLAAARRSAGGFERWLRDAHPDLAARLAAAASADGETPSAWLRMAVAEFDRHAGEEDWTTLISRLRDAPDPGEQCLLAMLEWRLAAAGTNPRPDQPSGQGPDDERHTEATRS